MLQFNALFFVELYYIGGHCLYIIVPIIKNAVPVPNQSELGEVFMRLGLCGELWTADSCCGEAVSVFSGTTTGQSPWSVNSFTLMPIQVALVKLSESQNTNKTKTKEHKSERRGGLVKGTG